MKFFIISLTFISILNANENLFTEYSIYFLLYLIVILLLIMFYYQKKLKSFNLKLEEQVEEKTFELRQLNELLEEKVQEKVQELINKDKILTTQSKQAVMGEMISMIAHQWRQPLSTITLQIANYQFKQLLLANSKEREIDKTLAEISDTIIYLSDTIDDFQTYFRPDRVSKTVKVQEVVDKVLILANAKIDRSNVVVNLEYNGEQEINIYVNELVQVLLNILNNAIEAFEKSEKKNKEVIISSKLEDNKISIVISDNADGIADENLKNLFNPYFSTKGKNGTGLGLYMSQMIIEKQFGGIIEVETSKAGTSFTISIPKNLS